MTLPFTCLGMNGNNVNNSMLNTFLIYRTANGAYYMHKAHFEEESENVLAEHVPCATCKGGNWICTDENVPYLDPEWLESKSWAVVNAKSATNYEILAEGSVDDLTNLHFTPGKL